MIYLVLCLLLLFIISMIIIGIKQNINGDENKTNDLSIENSKEDLDKYVEEQKRIAQEKYLVRKREQILAYEDYRRKENQRSTNNPVIIFKKKPSLDSQIKASEGVGIEVKVLGTKYRPVDDQLAAQCCEEGDDVILKIEKNPFSNTEGIAVYHFSNLLGFVASEQKNKALEHMYCDKTRAYIKEPWMLDKSWFSIVLADINC